MLRTCRASSSRLLSSGRRRSRSQHEDVNRFQEAGELELAFLDASIGARGFVRAHVDEDLPMFCGVTQPRRQVDYRA